MTITLDTYPKNVAFLYFISLLYIFLCRLLLKYTMENCTNDSMRKLTNRRISFHFLFKIILFVFALVNKTVTHFYG